MKKKGTSVMVNKILLMICCIFLAFILWCVVNYNTIKESTEAAAMILSRINI